MTEALLMVIGGFLAGFCNSLGSSGSAVTLPLMVFLGFSPTIANATNRVGILFGSVASTVVFHRNGKLNWPTIPPIALCLWAGTLVGVGLAAHVGERGTQLAIVAAVLLAFVMLLTGSRKFLRPVSGPPRSVGPLTGLILFVVGLWAGFIMLDSATFILLALVLGLNYDLCHANAIKSLMLTGVALISVVLFAWHGSIDWETGAVLAAGNWLGGWVGARAAVIPGIERWVYALLVTVISFELGKLLLRGF